MINRAISLFILGACVAIQNANAEVMSLLDGKLSCTLSAELIEIPESRLSNLKMKPVAAYRTENKAGRVAVTRGAFPQPMTLKYLPEVKGVMTNGFKSMFPNAEWSANEIVNVNERPWIHFDFVAKIGEQRSHSALYVTAFHGDQLQVLFQSNPDLLPKSSTIFESCVNTLTVND